MSWTTLGTALGVALLAAGCGGARVGEPCFGAEGPRHSEQRCASGLICALSTSGDGETRGTCEDPGAGLPAESKCKPSADGEPCAPAD